MSERVAHRRGFSIPCRGPVLPFLPGLFVAGLLAACGGGDGGSTDGWQATTDTIGDTIVVRTLSGSVWGEERALVAEVRIGVLEGDEAYMLGAVSAIAVSPSGEIYALDRQVPVLRKYAPDGRHIADFGRSGGGPGEYKNPDGLAVLSDGRVVVRDPGNARLQVFAADGVPLAEWPLPSGGGFSTSRKTYVDEQDNQYTPVIMNLGVAVTEWKWGLARVTPEGTVRDTLPVPTWDYEDPVVSGQSENSSSSTNVPYSPSTSWTFSPLGYYVGGLSTDYRIELFRTDAPLLRIERASWEAVPVPGAERAAQEQRITENFRDNFPGWRWNGPPIPDTKPPYRSIQVGGDGRIWVLVSQPSVEIMTEAEARAEFERTQRMPSRFREPVAFDVFEADGRYLGRVRVPETFAPYPEPVFRGDTVWAVVRDENDVSYIVRFRIDGTAAD